MKIASYPFRTGDVKLACGSDTILKRRDVYHVSDVLVFKEDARQQRDTCGDEWEIVWKSNFDSDAKRKDQRRGDTASLRHRGEVPGHNTCFFYDHLSRTVRTPDTREIKQLGGVRRPRRGHRGSGTHSAPSHHHCGLPAAKPWFSTRSTP